jgi:hypothetical protein
MNPRTPGTPNPDYNDPIPEKNPDVTPDSPTPGGNVESPSDTPRPGTGPGTTKS